YSLEDEHGSGSRLVPITMAKVKERWVKVRSLNSPHFDGVPKAASNKQITKLEEEKICGWYAGGTLYS
ncbi:MAG: photosynthetic reaction center subunit H, partial [Pseudomonadota bacterium]